MARISWSTRFFYMFSVNYKDRDHTSRPDRWQPLNMGLFITRLPRLILWCRAFDHKPVVDGTWSATSHNRSGYLWVECARCGVRSDPQGDLDPNVYGIGQRYRGPWAITPPEAERTKQMLAEKCTPAEQRPPRTYQNPGRIDKNPTGELGAQLIIGRGLPSIGWEIKIGNGGSEHTLAAAIRLGWLGALYLHTGRFGQGLQLRLNPTGYDSRLIGMEISRFGFEWRLWAKRDPSSPVHPISDGWYGIKRWLGMWAPPHRRHEAGPWWMHGAIRPKPMDWALGKRECITTERGEVSRMVPMLEGEYLVKLKLNRRVIGRARGPKIRDWDVDWSSQGRGFPTKGPERGRIYGCSVTVSDRAVTSGTWPAAAVAAIVAQVTDWRTREGWEPICRVPVDAQASA